VEAAGGAAQGHRPAALRPAGAARRPHGSHQGHRGVQRQTGTSHVRQPTLLRVKTIASFILLHLYGLGLSNKLVPPQIVQQKLHQVEFLQPLFGPRM
jgi:hypothetical protein